MYLTLYKVAVTPFHVQGDDICLFLLCDKINCSEYECASLQVQDAGSVLA